MSENDHPDGRDEQDLDRSARAGGPGPGDDTLEECTGSVLHLHSPAHGRQTARREQPAVPFSFEQRLLLLDAWRRSGLPAGDFAPLVGLSKLTLYAWKTPLRGRRTRRAGRQAQGRAARQSAARGDAPHHPDAQAEQPRLGLPAHQRRAAARPGAAGQPGRRRPRPARGRLRGRGGAHQPPPRPRGAAFERARPNQLWQTDLFTFVLKRQNRRVYLVAFMDDHSRFLVSYGLHASQSSALVLEVLRAAVSSHGSPEEILTDNGSQYVTWRGKSAFTAELEKRGVRQVVASPRHPQTLGKIERFWGTLWRECLEPAIFVDLADARTRRRPFIDHYNFQRPHQGIDGSVPADRFFGAAPEVLKTLKARVAANALELARQGVPKAPFYLTGQVGGQPFSVHAEGERVILTGSQGRKEVDLVPPAEPAATLPEPVCPQGLIDNAFSQAADVGPDAPGVSALDDLPSCGEAARSKEASHEHRQYPRRPAGQGDRGGPGQRPGAAAGRGDPGGAQRPARPGRGGPGGGAVSAALLCGGGAGAAGAAAGLRAGPGAAGSLPPRGSCRRSSRRTSACKSSAHGSRRC